MSESSFMEVIKCKTLYCNFQKLNDFFLSNEYLKTSFNEIICIHREDPMFHYEELLEEEERRPCFYFITYTSLGNIVVSTCRLHVEEGVGLISMVHVNEEYRGLKFCQKTIKKVIELSSLPEYKLFVENPIAKKCYEACEFKVVSYNEKEKVWEMKKDIILGKGKRKRKL
jgi:hypothetical protein